MMPPPTGTICGDCRQAPAAVQAGSAWVCWDCDEKASHSDASGAFEMAVVPSDGVDLRPSYRYDEPWAKLQAGVGRDDVVMKFDSRVDAQRATFALRKRAQLAGVRLISKRVGYRPLTMRYRLRTETK